MSDFVQQQHTICNFSNEGSWVILSPIEQSIKQKIETVGTPLKDWDIKIYRGVLTGYNDAFIISTEKRDEILANCQTEDERLRTAELIRPILRGRDIKRYGYEWANLWIINTHNGIKGVKPRIDINEYPAVKTHLDQYWDKISKRADKGDTPYNLRNCAYLDNLLQLIGKTPLVRLSNIYKDEYGTEIIAKVEYFNPGGSVKDRAAYAMIEAAETSGKLKKDGTIIEPTSGNTGIGMAWIAALKGYKVILTMPETMSIERRKLLKAFGSELVLTPGSEGMKGAIAKAEELNSQIKGSVILQQFKNPANPDIHYMTTANEIIEDAGKFDVFISCVGTGGSITGIGKRLKEKSPEIEIIAVEPKGSPVLSGGVAGPHKIQGIGAGFIPEIIERSYIDKIIQINDNDAFKMMRDLARKEGLLVGISSGAAVSVAVQVAQNCNYKGKRIVVLLPDTGERYLSMNIASIHDLEDY